MTAYEQTTVRLRVQQGADCPLVQDLLPLYLEGEVSPQSRMLIAEHVAECAHCAGFMAGAQSVQQQLRRDTQARAVVMQQSAPARATLGVLQTAIQVVATFALCAFAGLSSFLLGEMVRTYAVPLAGPFFWLASLSFLLFPVLQLVRTGRTVSRTIGAFQVGAVLMIGLGCLMFGAAWADGDMRSSGMLLAVGSYGVLWLMTLWEQYRG